MKQAEKMRTNPNFLEPIQSIYVHVPFCRKKCGYCDYYSVNTALADYDAYFEGIKQELEETIQFLKVKGQHLDKLKTLYFGGGTPSVLPPNIMRDLIALFKHSVGFDENIEITMEVNPETHSKDTVLAAIQSGVNRISLGYQAKQNSILKKIGREHNHQDFFDILAYIRKNGIENISCDLMFGLPGQTLDDVKESAEELVALQIPHISFYSLILEEGTLFFRQYNQHPELLPSDDLEREMYDYLLQYFVGNDYHYYELSSAAKNGYYSRHNYNYWTTKPYLGLGPGAHGYFAGLRKGNIRSIKKWLEDPFGNAEREEIDFELAMREYAMLAFRLEEGFSPAQFANRFGIQNPFQEEINRLIDKKLIQFNQVKETFSLTRKGLDFANEVFIEFV